MAQAQWTTVVTSNTPAATSIIPATLASAGFSVPGARAGGTPSLHTWFGGLAVDGQPVVNRHSLVDDSWRTEGHGGYSFSCCMLYIFLRQGKFRSAPPPLHFIALESPRCGLAGL